MRKLLAPLFATVALLAFFAIPQAVHAVCAPPEAATVELTIPADGATEVALDARFVVVASEGQPSSVSVGGVELQRDGLFWTHPEQLEPDTDYEMTSTFFVSDISDPQSDEEVVTDVVGFRTGTSTASSPPEAPVVNSASVLADRAAVPSSCLNIASNAGCADNGTPIYTSFNLGPDDSLAYMVTISEGVGFDLVWPAGCGDPVQRHYEWEREGENRYCFQVRAVDEAGQISAPTDICRTDSDDSSDDEGSSDDDSTCSSVDSSTTFLALILIGLFSVAPRRN